MTKPAAKWTIKTLERSCRRLMPRVSIVEADLGKISANCEWEGSGPIKIKWDRLNVGSLRAVIHELLHVVLDGEMNVFVEYGPNLKREPAELIIESLEDAIFKSVIESGPSSKWWRSAIAKRSK